MRSGLMTVALLCFIAWMSLAHASTHGRVSNCCRLWSNTKGIPHSRIRHYALQEEGICPIRAVVFHTRSGKRICSDPDNSWTKKIMSILDQRQASKMQGSKAEEPTSTIPPTASALTERLNTFFKSTTVQVVFKPEQTTLASPGSDPDSTRTTTAAMKTDKEPQMLQMKGNNEDVSATTIAPTTLSTSTRKPMKKGRRAGRRMRKKSRSGRKWMKKVHVVCEHSLSMDQ